MQRNQIVDLLLARVEELYGIVEVAGEPMVDRAVLRGVVESFLAEVCERLTSELLAITADDPEAAAKVPELVTAGVREIEHKIAELLPRRQ
jgi:hypothetical protein